MQIESTFILPSGFRVAGVAAGIKYSDRRDVMLLVSDQDAALAGVFTTNQVKAAPVKVDQQRVAQGTGRAVFCNAGIANACTGAPGMTHALQTCEEVGAALGLAPEQVLVCSTGSIGPQLPMDRLTAGIHKAVDHLGNTPEHAAEAAQAIMTTDTRPKAASIRLATDGGGAILSGITKGAGMIEPNMATMLAFLVTDLAVDPSDLQTALKAAVDNSFNRISIDGDTSTNDTVLLFANGAAGGEPLHAGHPQWSTFTRALDALCLNLAHQIVWDGEGMTKFITLRLTGARSDQEADQAVRAVANSFLVKTGWAGTYPVWGRIIDTLGYCPAHIDPDKVRILYDDVPVAENGMAAGTDKAKIDAVISQSAFTIHMDLGVGDGEAVLYTCDCTEEYVRINMF